MKRILPGLLFVLLGWSTCAQQMPIVIDAPNSWVCGDSLCPDGAGVDGARWRNWRAIVDVTTFFRDAEFFLPYTKGYTATGFFLNPCVKRTIGANAQVTLGVHLAGVAGYEGIRKWQPLVRLEYEPCTSWRLVMGSLYGALTHGLFEPMFDRERYIYDHQEEGVQILGEFSFGPCRLQTDTWIHWEELLEPWQATQERFTLGSNNNLELFSVASSNRKFEIGVPFSFLGSHRGGQFSALNTCIQTLFNENIGLRVRWRGQEKYSFSLDLPVFFYQDMSPTKCMAYDEGWGIWPQLAFAWKLHQRGRHSHGNWKMWLQGGYWYGYQFIAPRGSYLFQSISWHDSGFAVPEREMLTARTAIENRYGNLSLGLDAEFYYDLMVKGMDMAFGLYMRYVLDNE